MKESLWECSWCKYPIFPTFEEGELTTCPKCGTNGYVFVVRSSLEWLWYWMFDSQIRWSAGVVYPT